MHDGYEAGRDCILLLCLQGKWLRSWMIYFFAYNPATQFDYMVWDPPSLAKIAHA